MKSHTLSKEEEALMSLTMDLDSTPQSIFYMFNNADIRFESITDRQGNEIGISHGPVSYTHLDVYKRQPLQ